MEGILDFICLRQSFFHGHCIIINTTTRSALRTTASQSCFKSTNRNHFDSGRCCNCSDLRYVLFILFNFCLALLHKHCEEILGACRKGYYFNKFCLGFLESNCRVRLFGKVFFQSVTWQHVELHKNLTSGSNRSLRSVGWAKAHPLTKR